MIHIFLVQTTHYSPPLYCRWHHYQSRVSILTLKSPNWLFCLFVGVIQLTYKFKNNLIKISLTWINSFDLSKDNTTDWWKKYLSKINVKKIKLIENTTQFNFLPSSYLKLNYVGVFLMWLRWLGLSKNNQVNQ
jgi:hypothetical protein